VPRAQSLKLSRSPVRIYKRGRKIANTKGELREYAFFYVADYTGGKRVWRIFTDRESAQIEAGKIAGQLASGDTTAAIMRNGGQLKGEWRRKMNHEETRRQPVRAAGNYSGGASVPAPRIVNSLAPPGRRC